MNKIIFAQLIGIIAIYLWVISIQKKESFKILLYQAFANLFYTWQYSLLNVYSAAAMNFSSFLRCLLFASKKKKKQNISYWWLAIFLLIILFLGIITYNSFLNLIPLIITIFYTISSWLKDSKWLRVTFLLAAFVWIYYNYQVEAYICVIGNVFEIISALYTLKKYH